jgi:hypothetical protein
MKKTQKSKNPLKYRDLLKNFINFTRLRGIFAFLRFFMSFADFRDALTLYGTLHEPHSKNNALFKISSSFTICHKLSDGFQPLPDFFEG